MSNYITLNLPTSPTTTGASTISGGNVTLYASGAGTLNWYSAAIGGALVNTGTSYTIYSLTTNATYYVESMFLLMLILLLAKTDSSATEIIIQVLM